MTFHFVCSRLKGVLPFGIIAICCSFFNSNFSGTCYSENYAYIKKNTDQLLDVIDKSILLIDSNLRKTKVDELKSNYFIARKYYKHLEFFIEYSAPFDVKYFINGPLVKKTDLEIGNRIVDPHGFQVIEEQLFGSDSIKPKLLLSELQLLSASFKSFQNRLKDLNITDSQIIEAIQFELIRISSLTLNGYDATITKTNIKECQYVIEGITYTLNDIQKKYSKKQYPFAIHQQLILKLNSAKNYCSLHPEYESFNRLDFITQHIKPIYSLIVKLHRNDLFPFTPVNYAIKLNNEHLFEEDNYNLNYFTQNSDDATRINAQSKLGELLFFDPILSGNNQRACASCHKPELAFSDGIQKAIAFEKTTSLERNTPSLLNTSLQRNFFYDGRSRQLEQQANDVLHNEKEMNSSAEIMINRLNQSEEYQSIFKLAYKGTSDTMITYYGILKAIAEYEKTLISMNSRFDKYLKGDYRQLNKQEISGYNIFSGKALCGSCHFFPLFNGLVPPTYNDTEYEVIGVPEYKDNKNIDKDIGRMIVSKSYINQYAFKTPTVRNVSLTAPYMHNGIYKTLDEVVDFYNKGGGQGIGININHQTLPFDSLQLTKQEISSIKAFLLSLTDTVGLINKPKKLPSFKDKKLNKRIIGGVY